MKRAWGLSLFVALSVSTAGRVEAFQCPLVTQEAETTVDALRKGAMHPKARWYLEEASALIADAKAKHRQAKSGDDHERAVSRRERPDIVVGLVEAARCSRARRS